MENSLQDLTNEVMPDNDVMVGTENVGDERSDYDQTLDMASDTDAIQNDNSDLDDVNNINEDDDDSEDGKEDEYDNDENDEDETDSNPGDSILDDVTITETAADIEWYYR